MMTALFMLMLSDSCVAVRYTVRLLCVCFWKYLLALPVRGAEFQVQFNVFPLHRLLKTAVHVSGGVFEKTKTSSLSYRALLFLHIFFFLNSLLSLKDVATLCNTNKMNSSPKCYNSTNTYSLACPDVIPNLYSVSMEYKTLTKVLKYNNNRIKIFG